MQPLIRLLALAGLLSLTLADNTTSHDQLLSRQTVDCIPLFLEYPTALFIPCGNLYISNLCACCEGNALGCYTSVDVCSIDSYGNSVCCPQENPNCAIDVVSAATSAPPSSPSTTQVYESSPASTAEDSTSVAATTAYPTTSIPTQQPSSLPTSSSQSDINTDSNFGGGGSTGTTTPAHSAPTSSFLTGGTSGQSPNLCVRWEVFAMLLVFHFIKG